VALVPSLAKGGFSNVWGAAMLPYLQEDIDDWPLTINDLAPHYRAATAITGLAAKHDDLESRFPLYTDQLTDLQPSRQVKNFLHDLEQHRTELQRQGVVFGASRLAVRARNSQSRSCVYCAMCMYGCPYGLIYNTSSTLEKLLTDDNFTYLKDIVVQKLIERNGEVEILAESRINGTPQTFRARRVYLAAGALTSSKILLESLGAYHHPLTVKDSQYFLLPLLRYRGVAGAAREELHTLSQAFLEIFDHGLSPKSIHLQIYSYNDLYAEAMRNVLGPVHNLVQPASRLFLERFLLIQGYLHSDLSAKISLTLEPPRNGERSRLVLNGENNSLTEITLKKLVRKLWKLKASLKAIPLARLLNKGEPGRGFHAGGTFPMRKSPKDFETDIYGRPTGFQKVHVVDATVFPSFPASTVTLTVMANAHRIATATASL
jgi:choline dehydrogenase-like flavoprotein